MVIVYESKTGFTKRYADMIATKANLPVFRVQELPKVNPKEEIIFLGWMKVGKIQGLAKIRKHRVIAVCGSGTAAIAEPSPEEVIARNKLEGVPFFYLRGGCFPLREIKGIDKIMLSLFIKMLKSRRAQDDKTKESISIIENGFDGVKEENLEPVLEWLKAR
ncbi:MAG: flavodoxin domain-containing protein [Oscillospiraceae bacterium]|nr:flavodoxin domain-containing protein [Oscillospiraceae bacterium]